MSVAHSKTNSCVRRTVNDLFLSVLWDFHEMFKRKGVWGSVCLVQCKTDFDDLNAGLDVCLSVHRCMCVEKKNQLDATERFIALIICSTCFGHFYAHHQEFETICVLLPPMVCSALFAVCRRSGAEQQAMRPE